jgi:hypothetical protein
MTVARLFALPDGQRLRWADLGLFGVVEHVGGRTRISWSNGDASDISPADADLDGFARELSLVYGRGPADHGSTS